ncbi:peptide chain release factor 2 [Patescibacteria group bacterium]
MISCRRSRRRGTHFDVPQKKQEIIQLETLTEEPEFWRDQNRAKETMKRLDWLREQVTLWEGLVKETEDTLAMAKEAEAEHAQDLYPDLRQKAQDLVKKFRDNEFHVLLSGKYDERNAIVSIHSGTGGVDAQDWAEMLLRMYLRYAEKKDFDVQVTEEHRGEEAGIKSVTFQVKGPYAYGFLQSEGGVHRLVRQSPFNSDALRQTSFALVEVMPEIAEAGEIEISPEDLRIDTFRASGAGGQHVNKTDSAVRITHLPTKISVECQSERSQKQNKDSAMKILAAKLFAWKQQETDSERKEARGEHVAAQWGNQIRSYVLHPYKMVKDHRTKYETKDPEAILDGNLTDFIAEFLKWKMARK